jgi:hypothetical protein
MRIRNANQECPFDVIGAAGRRIFTAYGERESVVLGGAFKQGLGRFGTRRAAGDIVWGNGRLEIGCFERKRERITWIPTAGASPGARFG